MGQLPPSFDNLYILVAVDYVSKWVEVVALPTNDAKAVVKFLQKQIFLRFGTSRAIICGEKTYFCNKTFAAALAKYGIKYKVAITYYPQTSRQVDVSNREIKRILEKIVSPNRKDQSLKLNDSLWHIEQPTKLHLACPHIELFMEKLVTSHLSWSTKHIGQSSN